MVQDIEKYVIIVFADCFLFIILLYSLAFRKTYMIVTVIAILQHILFFYSG